MGVEGSPPRRLSMLTSLITVVSDPNPPSLKDVSLSPSVGPTIRDSNPDIEGTPSRSDVDTAEALETSQFFSTGALR